MSSLFTVTFRYLASNQEIEKKTAIITLLANNENSIDMDSKFTWVPLYEELAQALLRYKEDRTELVEWIYEDLGKVTRADGQSLVAYLKQKDGSKILDIDPFSVFAIFNRSTSWDNRTELLTHFKKKFRLTSTIPSDFNGIPTVDARRSFFFSWKSDNSKVIHDLWQLFEKVISDHDISEPAFPTIT